MFSSAMPHNYKKLRFNYWGRNQENVLCIYFYNFPINRNQKIWNIQETLKKYNDRQTELYIEIYVQKNYHVKGKLKWEIYIF